MSDVFEEVEENLRADQYANFFKRYGYWLIGALVALLVGVFGFTQYKQWSAAEAGRYAEKLDQGTQLLAKRDFEGASKYFTDLGKSGPAAYRAASLQLAATAQVEMGDFKGALVNLDGAAAVAPDPALRDSAKLKAAYLAAELEDFKTVQPRLQKLIDGKSPFAYEARELLGAEAVEAGDLAQARTQFEFLSLALDAPDGVRTRARAALAVIGSGEKPATPAASPAKPGDKK